MLCALSVTGAQEGVACLYPMTDPQMMQLDTVEKFFRSEAINFRCHELVSAPVQLNMFADTQDYTAV